MKRLDRAFWTAHSRTWDDALADMRVVDHIDDIADWFAARLGAASVVADLGCGTGNHARALGERGLRVVGIDGSPGMLARAATKVGRLTRADLGALPVREASLDGALSVYSAQFFDLDVFVAEVTRVVKPHGALLIELPKRTGTLQRDRLMSTRARAFQSFKNVAAAVGSRVGRVHAHTADDLRAALRGFRIENERSTGFSFAMLATRAG